MGNEIDLRPEQLLAFLDDHPGAISARVIAGVWPDKSRATGYRNLAAADSHGWVFITACPSPGETGHEDSCPHCQHAHYRVASILRIEASRRRRQREWQ